MSKGATLTKASQTTSPDAEMAGALENELHFQVRIPSPAIKILQLANNGRGRMWRKGVVNGTPECLPRRRKPSLSERYATEAKSKPSTHIRMTQG
jgi:hypothetical protein